MGDIVGFNKKITVRDALAALKVVQDFCDDQYQEDCDSGKCPLFRWCKVSGDRNEYPCNWRLQN